MFKNDELKKLLKMKSIEYKSKDKKSLLIRKYLEGIKNIKKIQGNTISADRNQTLKKINFV